MEKMLRHDKKLTLLHRFTEGNLLCGNFIRWIS